MVLNVQIPVLHARWLEHAGGGGLSTSGGVEIQLKFPDAWQLIVIAHRNICIAPSQEIKILSKGIGGLELA